VAALPCWEAPLARHAPLYDKNRGENYNLISTLHKSLRVSEPGVTSASPFSSRRGS